MDQVKSVLVTGAAGRIGRATAAELFSRGHRVRGFDRVPPPDLEDAVTGDLTKPEDVEKAFEGIEVAIHLAATPDESDFMTELLPNNIVGLYNVMEAARKAEVKRLVLASTTQVNSGHEGPLPITAEMKTTPMNWYGSTKMFAEAIGHAYSRKYGISVIMVRPAWCPRTRGQVATIASNEACQNSYLSPFDAGRFFACAAEAEKEIPYAILYVASKPKTQPRYDLSPARDLIGYEPQHIWPQGSEIVVED